MSVVAKERKKTSYFKEVRDEIKKVSWTPKSELIFCTKAVIIATFLFGLSIYAVDLGIQGILRGIGLMFQRIFG